MNNVVLTYGQFWWCLFGVAFFTFCCLFGQFTRKEIKKEAEQRCRGHLFRSVDAMAVNAKRKEFGYPPLSETSLSMRVPCQDMFCQNPSYPYPPAIRQFGWAWIDTDAELEKFGSRYVKAKDAIKLPFDKVWQDYLERKAA